MKTGNRDILSVVDNTTVMLVPQNNVVCKQGCHSVHYL